MGQLPYVESYRDLQAYRKAQELAREIFRLTKTFPKEETYSLTSQIRRSSRSIGAQIAEAWAKRSYERHFTAKLSDADGEQQETQHWIETAFDCEYITNTEKAMLLNRCEEIGRILGGMIAKSHLFCSPNQSLREEQAIYFVEGEVD
ncbi:MAG: four helix bundle protein [Caldilineales bacterium]|nr:four helix bundle protein [Caldilineales bacterium]MCW5856668.1 four helix bundle protein [Caldilineales bacterium]